MLDFVQVVSDHMGRSVGLDDDARHWVGVAVRESVINAIKHGNRNDVVQARLRRFRDRPGRRRPELTIRVRDEGDGFDPERTRRSAGAGKPAQGQRPRHLSDSQLHGPRAAAARARGRHGNPDDQARVSPPTDRRFRQPELPRDPLLLATAIEAVVRAGAMQMERFGGSFRVDKKGTIDLVTEVDVAVERMFRELVAERFPDHQVLAEEIGGDAAVPPGPCWVFDPIDGTTNFTHGLPIFCSSLALEIDGVAEVAAVYDPNAARAVHGRARRRRLSERSSAARVDDRGARRRDAGHRVPLRRAFADRGNRRSVRAVRRPGARRPAARIGGDRSLLRRRGAHGRLLGKRPQALGHRRRRADRGRGGRPRHEHGRQRRSPRAAGTCSPPTACCTTPCSRSSTISEATSSSAPSVCHHVRPEGRH